MKIRTQVYLISFSSSIIPLILLAIITFNFFKTEITKSERSKIDFVLQQGEVYLDNTFSNLNSKMNMLEEIYLEHDIEEIEEYIDIFSGNTYESEYFIIGDSSGVLYVGSDFPGALPDTYDPRIRPWYVGALTTKKDYFVSDVFTHASTGNPVVTVSKRIEKDGVVLGVVCALLRLELLGESLGRISNNKVTGFIVADINGKPLFCVEDGIIHMDGVDHVSDEHSESDSHEDAGEPEENLPVEFIQENFHKLLADGHIKYSSVDGNEIYYPHLIDFAGLALVGGVDETSLLQPVIHIQKVILIISIVTMLLSTIMILIFGNRFSSSMFRFSYIIDNIARGNYSKNLLNIDKYIDVDSELYLVKEGIKRMQREIQERERKLKLISEMDSLTKIYNKGAITDIINMEINRSKSFGSEFTLIMFDLDRFKNLNDTFGHIFGDLVLERVASSIKSQLKSTDIFGRYGGEEFVILLPDTNVYGGAALAERLRKTVSSLEWEEDTKVTASFGVAGFVAPDSFEVSISIVDGLLYQAKKEGRNRVIANTPKN